MQTRPRSSASHALSIRCVLSEFHFRARCVNRLLVCEGPLSCVYVYAGEEAATGPVYFLRRSARIIHRPVVLQYRCVCDRRYMHYTDGVKVSLGLARHWKLSERWPLRDCKICGGCSCAMIWRCSNVGRKLWTIWKKSWMDVHTLSCINGKYVSLVI